MDDTQLAQALHDVSAIESALRQHRSSLAEQDLAERDAVQVALRQAIAFRKPLETWLATRAMRARLR